MWGIAGLPHEPRCFIAWSAWNTSAVSLRTCPARAHSIRSATWESTRFSHHAPTTFLSFTVPLCTWAVPSLTYTALRCCRGYADHIDRTMSCDSSAWKWGPGKKEHENTERGMRYVSTASV